MSRNLRFYCLCASLLFFPLVTASAIAQEDSRDAEVMAAYRAYNDAVENGDAYRARQYAKDAYELAEEAWGADRKDTALLATNYADALSDRERWRPALRVYDRCVEILQRFEEALSESAYCQLGAANALMARGDFDDAKERYWSVIESLQSAARLEQWAAGFVGEAYLRLAMMSDNAPTSPTPRGTIYSGETSSRIVDEPAPPNYDAAGRELAEHALAYLQRGYEGDQIIVAQAHRIAGNYAELEEDFDAAEHHYAAAFGILNRIHGADHPDTISMDGRVAWVKRLTREMPFEPEPTREPSNDKCRVFVRDNLEIELCVEKRYPPYFPNEARFKGQQGFSIIRYDVTQSGETENARIEHSWPGGIFDERSLENVGRWKYYPPTDQFGNRVPLLNVETQITYVIR